ncbi:unnamed protein product [Boreogadus saida]
MQVNKCYSLFNAIYSAQFGVQFIRTIVIEFRIPVTRSTNTEAEVELLFRATAAEVPQPDVIRATLVDGLNNPNITTNLTIDPDSITAKVQITTTTRAPTTTGSPTTAAPTAAVTASVGPVATAAPQLTSRQVVFRSAGETFTNDLLNSSSAAFIARATLLRSQLEPFFSRSFGSFNSINVVSFSDGSIINTLNVWFNSNSVPDGLQILNVFTTAAQSITAFNIETSSITVQGLTVTVSTGVTHKSSVLTALVLVALSWSLSRQS